MLRLRRHDFGSKFLRHMPIHSVNKHSNCKYLASTVQLTATDWLCNSRWNSLYSDIPRTQEKQLQHKSDEMSADKERLFEVNLPPSVRPWASTRHWAVCRIFTTVGRYMSYLQNLVWNAWVLWSLFRSHCTNTCQWTGARFPYLLADFAETVGKKKAYTEYRWATARLVKIGELKGVLEVCVDEFLHNDSRTYCLVWVKLGVRNRNEMLSSIRWGREDRDCEGRTFLAGRKWNCIATRPCQKSAQSVTFTPRNVAQHAHARRCNCGHDAFRRETLPQSSLQQPFTPLNASQFRPRQDTTRRLSSWLVEWDRPLWNETAPCGLRPPLVEWHRPSARNVAHVSESPYCI